MKRPNFVTNEHLEYLDELRESGKTNMFGATPYIQKQFPELSEDEARVVLKYWIKEYENLH